MSKIILGSRGSDLALYQTRSVISALRACGFDGQVEERVINTSGDIHRDVMLSKFAKGERPIVERGIFTKALEDALLEGKIDAAVHSLKDLPSQLDENFIITAVLPRASAEDLLIVRGETCSLNDLPAESCVATGSVRRARFVGWKRPDIQLIDIRGNVPTRLRKLEQGNAGDATILARAGLQRLGFYEEGMERIQIDDSFIGCSPLSVSEFVPAAGQGAVAVETLLDSPANDALKLVNDLNTEVCVSAEREFLRLLGAGCDTPVGVNATLVENKSELEMTALVFDETDLEAQPKEGKLRGRCEIGRQLASELLEQMGIETTTHG